jgi:hypothetical protein
MHAEALTSHTRPLPQSALAAQPQVDVAATQAWPAALAAQSPAATQPTQALVAVSQTGAPAIVQSAFAAQSTQSEVAGLQTGPVAEPAQLALLVQAAMQMRREGSQTWPPPQSALVPQPQVALSGWQTLPFALAAQSASAAHSTHCSCEGSQTAPAAEVAQSLFDAHPTQVCVAGLQTLPPCEPAQSALVTHATQVLVAASQRVSVGEKAQSAFVAHRGSQTPDRLVFWPLTTLASHTGAAAGQSAAAPQPQMCSPPSQTPPRGLPLQSASTSQATHTRLMVSQTGVPAMPAQSLSTAQVAWQPSAASGGPPHAIGSLPDGSATPESEGATQV